MTCSDMCQAAAEKLLAQLGWKSSEIDLLIFLSRSMDYILPATACVLHEKMGLKTGCACFDIAMGCSGWVYALSVAGSMVQCGAYKKALLLMGEEAANLSSAQRDEFEKYVVPLFGDAGTATALEFDPSAPPMFVDTYTDGTGYESIICRAGGCRVPLESKHLDFVVDAFGQKHRAIDREIDGAAVFVFGITQAPHAVKLILQRTGQSVEDIDYFLFHQANFMMNEQIRKKCKIPLEKCPYSLRNFGNCSSASIPLTMVTQIREQLIGEKQRKIIACGFGVGLSWGVISFDTQSVVTPPLKFKDLHITMALAYNPMKLTNKVILVTGASSGIGRAIAIECSKLGATCVLTARNMERLQKTLTSMRGEGHSIISADLTDTDAVADLVEQLPKLDGASLNAGMVKTILCRYAKMEDVHELFNIHYFSVVGLATSLLKKRKLAQGSSVVMMSSTASYRHEIGNGFYGAAKAALSYYTLQLSKELKKKEIRFNSVRPGMIETPMTTVDWGENHLEEDKRQYLYGRYGKPEEVAHLVAYLLSDAAVWITGSEFTIDGGVCV